ncbi:hypothetical protein VB711_14515 [Cronbergia sp. UHCC 0137]|uniref:hypothetical protein n=1 Tax=Cronbergia sp. UHCC 0137 TaxID=3110239 RepID=UPI002B1F8ED3|nr:hypothetical protein [Cronbergia sp. UHCC 0137]MEA5619042.1 hypothetical protein [Cronbergia sp. UHCC 0137]
MNTKITTVLVTIVTVSSLNISMYAQSTPMKPQSGSFILNGDSLINIDQRSSESDFGKFFEQNSGNFSSNQGENNSSSEELPLTESISLPSNSVFLQPASQSFDGNDGVQVQLDLRNNQ